MASLDTAFQLYDGMSPALSNISKAIDIVSNKFKTLQTASSRAIKTDSIKVARVEITKAEMACESLQIASSNSMNTSSFQAARMELTKVEMAYVGINEEIQKTAKAQDKLKAGVDKIKSIEYIFNKISKLKLVDEEIFNEIKDRAFNALDPLRNKISEIMSSDSFQNLVNMVIGGITAISIVASGLAGLFASIVGAIIDNWSWIGPIIWGIVSAFIAFNATTLIATAIQKALKIATDLAALAQKGFNFALSASPLTWIIVIIIALIAAFYAVIGVINKFAGTSISATGVIMGAFAAVGAFIANLFMGLLQVVFGIIEFFYNKFAAFANFFGNLFNDPIGAVIKLFADLADNVLGVLEKIASGIDFIFGTKMADTVKGWRTDIQVKAEAMMEKYGNGTYEDKVKELDMDSVMNDLGLSMERFNYGDAFNSGYKFGDDLEDKFDLGKLGIGNDLTDLFNDSTDPAKTDDMLDGINNTASNTASMANSMDISNEELKYMRDLAEQEVINRFTTAEIKVEMNNQNTINSQMDLDGVVSYLGDKLYETMVVTAEGVHE